jgi:hypothetical protein
MASSPMPGHPTSRRDVPRGGARVRDQRGAAFPSPLVMLSVIAIAMAGFAFFATGDEPALERRIETSSSAETPTPSPSPSDEPSPSEKAAKEEKKPKKKPEPEVVREKTYIEVFNNSGITGLAASYSGQATGLGWQVVAEDNWVGTIPASTVYYPARLKDAAEQLALDLGIDRTMPAVAPMNMDRLTVILTADAA